MAVLISALVFATGILALVFAFLAIRNARTSQGAVAWVVFLLSAPFLAVLVYPFLGHNRVHGYIVARRASEQVRDGAKLQKSIYPAHRTLPQVPYQAFESIAEMPVVSGNDMRLLTSGAETFDAIFAALDAAERYVLVQFYIIRDDALGRALRDRMIACARRGITVRLLFDAVGSSGLPAAYLDMLRDAGVQITNIHSLRGPKTRFQLNFRNHRKTVVTDGSKGFIGGFNVGDEYMGRSETFGQWRDTHCVLEGPVVSQLQLVFAEDWAWATDEDILGHLTWQVAPAKADMDALIMATGPADDMETGSLYFSAAISAAQDRIWIASPYLVPETDIMTALKLAALRGVDVRILVPDMADHRITWLAAFAYFDELNAAGVQIWRYTQGFMHQKVLVVDESFASVGTTNMDNRSCRLNFEATAMVFDATVARATARMLSEDLTRCTRHEKPLAAQNWPVRYGAPVARLFAPLL